MDAPESRAAEPIKAWPFVLLGLALFGVAVTAWRPIPAGVWHDDGVYLLVGKALAEGHGLVYAGVVDAPPAAKFPPLYPLVLAAIWSVFGSIGPVTFVATMLNLALLAAAGALFARALVMSGGIDLRAALVIAGLTFASTDVLRTALLALSESTFLFLLASALVVWKGASHGDRRSIVVLALVLVGIVATRTAGIGLVLAFALSFAMRRSWVAGLAATVPAVLFASVWSRWSGRASEQIPEGARDLLGPYGGWLAEQTLAAPGAFLAGLPRHALGVAERATALVFPGVVGQVLWLLAFVLGALVLVGAFRMLRRFPPLAWFGGIYLAMLLVWPYLDRRLVVPWHPFVIAAMLLGAQAIQQRVRGRALERVAVGLALIWVVAYSSVTAGRIAEGWPTEAYRLRADRLAASVEALSRTAPPEAIVGAPEFWAALHLHGGWTVAPSVRFDPRNVDPETPMWGTPEEQLALWRESRIDHLLLEQNGVLHGDALDRLEAECPGSVFVLARMPSSLLVRLDWASSCEGSGA
ncbi:MAG: hypothetical protein OEN56_10280 [Gemmatimonadota bacterium]|nr:hypothetical protein [Gemmatimonadota bacterium]